MLYWPIISGASFLLLVSFDETVCGTLPRTGVHLKPASGPDAPVARLKKTIVDAHADYHGQTNPSQENAPPAHQSSLRRRENPLIEMVKSNDTLTARRPASNGSLHPEATHSLEQSSFTAFTVSYYGPVQGPFPVVKIVTFNKVITNIGGGFDPMFSVFTSKASGVYFFSVSVVSPGAKQAIVNLVHDGRNIMNALAYFPHDTAVMTAYLHVVAGGRVWVTLDAGFEIYGHYHSFSGSLVKLDATT